MTETHQYEFTNQCTCQVYEDDSDEAAPVDFCFGDCWDDQMSFFVEITQHLFEDDDTHFAIEGFPLWSGPVSGVAECATPSELLSAITINGDWILKVTPLPTTLECVISHHDVPMGGSFTVRKAGWSD
jgi:hypothetical protein